MCQHKLSVRIGAAGDGAVVLDGIEIACRNIKIEAGVKTATSVTLEIVDIEIESLEIEANRTCSYGVSVL